MRHHFMLCGMKSDIAFHIAVRDVRERDPRFAPQAYDFLCESLEYTVKSLKRENAEDRHVTGPQLLVGFREKALLDFGPMAWTVMREWGVRCSEDVGTMVYNLINIGYFGKNETDSIEDFSDGISLKESLTKPYLPPANP
jgi:uncharacterized repeat protein (TIGR04138 family)